MLSCNMYYLFPSNLLESNGVCLYVLIYSFKYSILFLYVASYVQLK